MRIAIHPRPESFSDDWISFCLSENIPFKIVDCYKSDIIEQLADCDALMWHHNQNNPRDVILAKDLLFALQHAGKKVFPDFYTGWHFDDKLAQKYLLEAIGAKIVPTYTFYSKHEALQWAENTDFPKVFKLRGGSGSSNVKLIKNKRDAKKIIKRSFHLGVKAHSYKGYITEKWRHFKDNKKIVELFKMLVRLFVKSELQRNIKPEINYVYFQDFIPNNPFDIRVIVIGKRAFALKRMNRKNDFRASGSGYIIYDNLQIDINCIKIAFEVNQKLKCQSVAFDFIFDENQKPLIVEISYGYVPRAYTKCPGYWDNNLEWHGGEFVPQFWMVEGLIMNLNQ